MTRYDTYLFDFFGVIVDEVADRWFTNHLPNTSIEELRLRYLQDADRGTLSFTALCDALGTLSHQTSREVAEQWNNYAHIRNDVVAQITKLKNTARIGLCSNAPSGFVESLLTQYNLEHLFDVIVISSNVQMVKPDTEIYLHTLKQLDADPETTLYIDDTADNIHAAKQLGMRAVLFADKDDLSRVV